MVLYTGTLHKQIVSVFRYAAHFWWLCTQGHGTFLVSVHGYIALVALYTGTLHISWLCTQEHGTFLVPYTALVAPYTGTLLISCGSVHGDTARF